MSTIRYTIHPPQLVGRLSKPRADDDPALALRRIVGEYDDAMQELQRFLKYLMNANDATQVNVTNIDSSIETITEEKADKLEPAPPKTHTHLNTDLPNSLPTDGSRPFDLEPAVPTRVGSMYWDATDQTVSIRLPRSVVLQVGQETLLLGYNNTLATIANGKVVKITGAAGQRVTIALADNTNHNDIHSAIGVVTEDAGIARNQQGFVTIRGLVRNVDTSLWADGTPLYLSTAGGLTSTIPPKPGNILHVAVVVKGGSGGAGSIFVSLGVAERLDELTNVASSPSDQNIIQYDSATQIWKNVAPESAFGPRSAHPTPHTHLVSDVLGAGTGSGDPIESFHAKPHTHLVSDVLGAGTGSGGDPLESFRARPHTHTEADLMNVVTVDNTGSPGTGLTLGDFILASRIFGF